MARLEDLRTQFTESFEHAVRERENLSLAISGGATALVFLGALRVARVNWSRVTLLWADERAAPADSPESNYGVAERMLLQPLAGGAPRALRMPADLPDLEEAALQYDETLAYELRGGPLEAVAGLREAGADPEHQVRLAHEHVYRARHRPPARA